MVVTSIIFYSLYSHHTSIFLYSLYDDYMYESMYIHIYIIIYIYYYIIYILHIIFSSCFNPQNQTTEPSSWDVRSPFAKWSHRAWGGHSWDPRLSTGSLGSWYFNACVLNDSMLKTSEDMWM